MKLIALLTDYGLSDHYVGVVKAVIKGISPEAEFIDLTHEVAPFEVRDGAFLLLEASRYLPPGCTVMAVIDPGVNTKRRAIAVETKKRVFIGPDNGLLYPAASQEGIISVYDVGKGPQVLSQRGTFAGRDIFAPTAAYVSMGRPLDQLGRRSKRMLTLRFPRAEFAGSSVTGAVMHVDRFGNAVTNIDGDRFHAWRKGKPDFRLRAGGKVVAVRLASSYQEVKGVGLLVGSGGTLEISRREGSPGLALKPGRLFSLEITRRSP
jgi:hypothetical protein